MRGATAHSSHHWHRHTVTLNSRLRIPRMSRDELLAYRKSLGRTPALERITVRARGLDFAVWTSTPVAGALPLLLVNGGMLFDHRNLWPALSPLARSRQVILYDQRGRGESAPPDDVASSRIEDDGEDIGALRRALGLRQWDVLGHSWGGGISMLGVARDLAGTRKLVTVDAVGPTSSWMRTVHEVALERVLPEDREIIETLAGQPLHAADPDTHERHARAVHRAWFSDAELASHFAPPRGASHTGASALAALRRTGYDWSDRLRALSVPTLVIHGEDDALPPSVAHELASLLPRATLEIIPGAGHMPFLEAPRRFFDLVERFLGASSTPPVSAPPRSR